jgi:DNA-binding NarL/FixJ family response regulator
MIRVLLAEDHHLVRAGLRALLDPLPDIEVVGEAGDGREALAMLKNRNADVAILDISMPGMNGLEAAVRMSDEAPGTKVVILTMHSNEEYVLRALRAGVAGFLLKDAGTAELEGAIRAVTRGETYLSPGVSKKVVDGYLGRSGGAHPLDSLTPRQREVLQLIAEGYSTKQIAGLLGVGVKTIETHRTQLMDRLGIHEIAGLVRYAVRVGLVSPEP